MSAYALPLLAIIALCVLWGVFQLWLVKVDPDAGERSQKCGTCGRRDDCSLPGSDH